MTVLMRKRLAAIEAVASEPDDFVVKRVIFVGPGHPPELHSCRLLGHPGRFVREPEETEEAFMARVESVARARRKPGEFVGLILAPADAENGTPDA